MPLTEMQLKDVWLTPLIKSQAAGVADITVIPDIQTCANGNSDTCDSETRPPPLKTKMTRAFGDGGHLHFFCCAAYQARVRFVMN